jgi:hypothetical protein
VKCRHTMSTLVLTMVIVFFGAVIVSGCSGRVTAPRSDRSAQPTTAADVAVTRGEKEVEGLLASLASADATSLAFDREIRLLSASDPKRLVHSVAPQIPGAKDHLPRALREFDAVYDADGVRAAYDALIAAAGPRPPTTELVGREADFYWLSPSVIEVSELFQRRGTLSGSLPLRRINLVDMTATLTYGRPGETPVVLLVDVERDPAGNLRIVGLRGLRPDMLRPQVLGP